MLELDIPRASLDLEDPFRLPPGCSDQPLVDSRSGEASRLVTTVAAFRDDTALHVLFRGDDDALMATHLERDANLYEEDVVEVFLAPERPERYFEIEVNPLGTLFDAAVDSPDRNRSTMNVDRAWTCDGLWASHRRSWTSTERFTFATLISIPFAPLGTIPVAGDRWRANFYRIDRHPTGDLYLAWSPTMRTPPDFHVPDAFGTLRFS